jgi:Uma2 family endonuclease
VRSAPREKPAVPPLENGAHLSGSEFLRRYQAMPEVKKAELIQGIVYMASPVSGDNHGEPDNIAQCLLGNYATDTPGVKVYSNSTVRFGAADIPQPDVLMRLLPERGGRSQINEKGYVAGVPELVVEIAASSASVDSREKLETYRRFGVPEYLLWRTEQDAIELLHLEEDEYRPLPVDAEGIVRSRVFPGLWLDFDAMLRGDRARVKAVLEQGLRSAEHAEFIR